MCRLTAVVVWVTRVLVVALVAMTLGGCPSLPPCTSGLMRLAHGECPTRCSFDPAVQCYEDGGVIPDAPRLDAAGFDVPVNCDGGMTACSGACVSTTEDPSNCGACGRACPPVTGGTPTCSAGVCGFACATGSHACGATCLRDDSPESCGTRCTPCDAPTGAMATCTDGTCGVACPTGFALVGGRCDVLVPTPLGPMSTTVFHQGAPTIRWTLPTGLDSAVLEICQSRACDVVARTVLVTGSQHVPSPPLTAGAWFWRLRGQVGTTISSQVSATWEMFIEPRVGAAARPFGARVDFDGDGRADIAVSGGCSLDPGGIVTIYLGAAAATLAAPSMQIANPLGPTDVSFSTGLAYAGDVNGDGFGDLFVTAPFSGDGGHGYLYAGSPSGLGSVPSNMIDGVPTESIYIEAASIGDTDADGFGDIVVESNSSLMIIRGSSAGLRSIVDRRIANAPETIGHAIAGGYDLDSDGWPDIVVASRSSTSAAVRVYDGHDPTRLIATIPSPDVGDTGFGTSLAQGDVDGDGLADLMVGAPRYQSSSGRAYIFYNSPVPDFSTT